MLGRSTLLVLEADATTGRVRTAVPRFAEEVFGARVAAAGLAVCGDASGALNASPVLPIAIPAAEAAATAARLNVSIFLRANARDTRRIVGRFNKGGPPMAARRGVAALMHYRRSGDRSDHTCTRAY
jgi:hypothetical protein